jgi:hypothetical protein
MRPLTSTTLMKDLYVGLAALRNGYNILMENLMAWLLGALAFVADSELEPAHTLQQVWQWLDIEDDVVEALVRMRLLWKGGRLLVAEGLRDQIGFLDELAATLMSVWRFSNYCDSRWLTIGPAGRSLIASVLTGLDDVIAFSRRHGCSEYYIHGVDRLVPEVRSICVVAAIGSNVAEMLLREIMEDDRVMKHLAWLKDVVATEARAIEQMPLAVWNVLALEVLGASAHELRSNTLRASLVTQAHLKDKLFDDTARHPFSLCAGDKHQNLLDLQAGLMPTEPMASQLWILLKRGFSIRALVEVLEELEDLCWSSLGVEQAHAGASQVLKHHPGFFDGSMMSRSMLYTMRSLVTLAAHTARLTKLEHELEKLRSERPRCASGRHAFLCGCFLGGSGSEWSWGAADCRASR